MQTYFSQTDAVRTNNDVGTTSKTVDESVKLPYKYNEEVVVFENGKEDGISHEDEEQFYKKVLKTTLL